MNIDDRLNCQPLANFSTDAAQKISTVWSDLDDTITTEGILSAPAYDALWTLKNCGIKTVIVSGRPAGWCDCIARIWPVTAVIGENGGFSYAYNSHTKTMHRYYYASDSVRAENRIKLTEIKNKIIDSVAGSAVASDQAFRMCDLAIDHSEDVAALSYDAVQSISEVFSDYGAQSKISSIHVNGWYGHYDKWTCAQRLARKLWRYDLTDPDISRTMIYCGDSPNDEPMFQNFAHSVAVANIRPYLASLRHYPTFITQNSGGAGFVELVKYIIACRSVTI